MSMVKIIMAYIPISWDIPSHLLPKTMKGKTSKFTKHQFSKLAYVGIADDTDGLETFIKEWIKKDSPGALRLKKMDVSNERAAKIVRGPQ